MNPLIQREELKRERSWTSQERWRLIQKAIAWAETQSTVRRNTPHDRLEEQARKLAFMTKSSAVPVPSRPR